MRFTEKDMIKQLQESAEQYKPLIFKKFEEEFLFTNRARADAIVEISTENGLSFRLSLKLRQ
jgi:hypothetical protein